MCDYSLASLRSRLAEEGERLVVYRFATGSLGFASPAELKTLKNQRSGWRALFQPKQEACAVCLPPGARLQLHDVPRRFQAIFGIGADEEVTFTQRSAEAGRYRDGIRLRNHQEILLQRLIEGQSATVLSLGGSEAEPEDFRGTHSSPRRFGASPAAREDAKIFSTRG